MGGNSINIYTASKYLYFALKLVGLAPYSIDQLDGSFVMGLRNYLILFTSVLLWAFTSWYQAANFLSYDVSSGIRSLLLDRLWQYQYLCQHILMIFGILNNFLQRKQIENFLRVINQFDQRAKKLGWDVVNKSSNFFVLASTISCVLTIFAVSMSHLFFLNGWENFDQIAISDHILGLSHLILIDLFYLLICLQFIFSCSCIISKLQVFNKNINKYFTDITKDIKSVRVGPTYEREILKNYAIMYDLLADAVGSINAVFSKQMIIVFIPALMQEIFTIYAVIKMLLMKIVAELWAIGSFTAWNIYLSIPSVIAIWIGAKTAFEGQKLHESIGKYSNHCEDERTIQKIYLLLHKLQNRPIQLTCGFFKIDWTLGISIIGTIATYMIIICQFENDN